MGAGYGRQRPALHLHRLVIQVRDNPRPSGRDSADWRSRPCSRPLLRPIGKALVALRSGLLARRCRGSAPWGSPKGRFCSHCVYMDDSFSPPPLPILLAAVRSALATDPGAGGLRMRGRDLLGDPILPLRDVLKRLREVDALIYPSGRFLYLSSDSDATPDGVLVWPDAFSERLAAAPQPESLFALGDGADGPVR